MIPIGGRQGICRSLGTVPILYSLFAYRLIRVHSSGLPYIWLVLDSIPLWNSLTHYRFSPYQSRHCGSSQFAVISMSRVVGDLLASRMNSIVTFPWTCFTMDIIVKICTARTVRRTDEPETP